MFQELSYQQIKASSDARISEEVRNEQRKRNALLLVLSFLEDEGYLGSVGTLEAEAGVSLKKFQICDNIDLVTILQEFESYYYVKFNKWPKMSKKVGVNDKSKRPAQPTCAKLSNQKSSSCSLPKILHTIHQDDQTPSKGERSASDTTRKPSNSATARRSAEARRPSKDKKCPPFEKRDVESSEGPLEVSGQSQVVRRTNDCKKSTVVDHKSILSNTLQQISNEEIHDQTDKLLKPLAGHMSFSGEFRDLANMIQREIYSENPYVRWDDIIGLAGAKRLVKESVVYPIKYPQLFTGILSPWKGLLLYGPPGTGKTLLAKAVATECKTTFFNISASTIVSKWRGDSEKLVRVLFELARYHAPSTIFLDELDSLMGQRGSEKTEHEGSRRMKTELLLQMDGLSKTEDLVFLLAASNLPWELDRAMLRRLEKRILVSLPTEDARAQMIQHFLPPKQTTNQDAGGLEIVANLDYSNLAKKTDHYSGSDIRLVCKEAAMIPVRKIFDVLENYEQDMEGRNSKLPEFSVEAVTNEHFERALERTKPSAGNMLPKYEAWKNQFESA